MRARQSSQRGPRSDASSGGSLVRMVSDIEELMLLVREEHVCQLHIKFREPESHPATGESPESVSGCRPLLRNLVRPTDWETVRAAIEKFSSGRQRDKMNLPSLWVKAFDRSAAYIQSRQASLQPCKDFTRRKSGHLWLHLNKLRHEERAPRPPSELADLAELSESG